MTIGAKLFRAVAIMMALAMVTALPARAANKDMIQLQTQMQALQDAIARLQQSNDERMGVLKDLVQQTADSVNKMTLTVGTLKNQMDRQTELAKTKEDGLAGQIQGLNDSLDELRARMDKMQKMLGDVQGQQAQTNAMLSAATPAMNSAPAPSPAPSTPPAGAAPVTRSNPGTAANNAPQPGAPLPMPDDASVAPANTNGNAAAPVAVADMYRNAYSDYMSGKTALASSEFADVVKAYPDDNLAGNAYFYMGDINLKANKPTLAIKNYDHTIEHYPNNAKIPQAQLHKAQALLATGQKQSAALELRALIQRYPTSPEAAQAKTRLATISGRR